METNGVRYTGNQVEVDGRLVTGNGPEAAEPFAESFLALLEKQ